jgi:hypothetical protein
VPPVGTNTLTAEFDDLDDCESCFSGLLQVNYPEGQHPLEDGEGKVGDEDEDDEDEQERGDEEDATDGSNDGDIDDTADSATIETDDEGTGGGD